MQKLQSKLAHGTENDLLYYMWDSVIYSSRDRFARLDKTYLYVVDPQTNTLQQIIGYVDTNKVREALIRYSTTCVYRIT